MVAIENNCISVPGMIKLETKDGEVVETDGSFVKHSITLSNLFKDLGIDASGTADIIPLTNISVSVLKKILVWAEYHKDDAVVTEQIRLRTVDDIIVWDQEFFNIDQGLLFEIILAANYLHMEVLLDTTCKIVASMISVGMLIRLDLILWPIHENSRFHGKKPEEIRRTFNIPNDLTPEEEAMIRSENAWCEE